MLKASICLLFCKPPSSVKEADTSRKKATGLKKKQKKPETHSIHRQDRFSL
jgi:hypothetical protein